MRTTRSWRPLAACVLVSATLAACGDGDGSQSGLKAEPTAGSWRPWVLTSAAEVPVPPPPGNGSNKAGSDLDEVKRLADQRPANARAMVDKWGGPVPTFPWLQMAMDFVSQNEKNPPLSSRNYALVSVAMYDAVLTAWHAKYQHRVDPPKGVETLTPPGPDPSYPSEHAAIAGAASRVLAHLYPNQAGLRLDEMAEEAAQSRVLAGTNTPSDVAAGLDLGRAVAEKVIAYAQQDGAGRRWDGRRPPGIGRGPAFWEPPPGSTSPPTEPTAGTWKPWVMSSGDQFRPGPPPAYGSPEFLAAARELVDIRNNLTPEQERIGNFWAGAEGSPLPAGIIDQVITEDLRKARLTIPRSARAYAMVNVAMADAGIAAWDAKFTYWNPRPENAIRDSGVDPNFKPLVGTPRFPAYPSGSAGYAGAAQAVMTSLFPQMADEFRRRAEEQAMSRLYAGIHWRYDAVSLDAGRKIGELVVQRSAKDGPLTG
jgi:membrane-associated phospholipid phosphatase